ncbi:hypothetical protein C7S20_16225 [Christiangramia fulva]|uniref:DUF4377 domain-containing protein n=2 Tax=Christiangramia fulva TaxID=2126553 RepID=A0A2R3ZB51_9FLAO|nr:hypothetical protein C7S20_16225 [Christiangramia fulva]
MLLLFLAQTCAVGDIEGSGATEMMRINHYKQTAFAESPVLVMLVQKGNETGGEDWKYFYDEIEGFDYQPGYIYELQVRKKKVNNPPQDASSIKYILVKVISKNAVETDEEFDINLKWNGTNFVIAEGDNRYSLLNEYDINCQDLCDEMTADLENDEEVIGTFLHDADNSLKLVAVK